MSFPTNFPVTALADIIGYLRGQGVGRRAAAEAAYDLLGYGLGVVIPADAPALKAANQQLGWELLSDAALGARLEEFQTELTANPNAAYELPPWVIPILLDVLRRILAG